MSCVWACLRVGAPFAVFRSSSSQQEERRCACAKVQDKSWKRVEKPCSDDQCQDCGELYKTGLPIREYGSFIVQTYAVDQLIQNAGEIA